MSFESRQLQQISLGELPSQGHQAPGGEAVNQSSAVRMVGIANGGRRLGDATNDQSLSERVIGPVNFQHHDAPRPRNRSVRMPSGS